MAAVAVFGLVFLPRCWQTVNTDFPNYYVAARLVREGYATDRLYEWEWFARQKDRMQVAQPLAGFIPHPPFCALVMLPIAQFSPLTAKRIWIVLNLGMLALLVVFFARISGFSWRWWAIGTLLYTPTIRNLEFGQLYILILLVFSGALWLYRRGWKASSGFLLALAACLKIFPAFFLLYFIRKREHKALFGFLAGVAGATTTCLFAFRAQLLLTFTRQVLPAALQGEGNDPFSLTASSISAILHHLFIYDAQWNPHPVAHLPALFAFLQPTLQWLILGIAVVLISEKDIHERAPLEWGTLIIAALTLSTMPASYHFVLLLLPLAVWTKHLAAQKQYGRLCIVIGLVLMIGSPKWPSFPRESWLALLAVPRLWCLLILCALCFALLARVGPFAVAHRKAWIFGAALLVVVQSGLMLNHIDSVHAASREPLISTNAVFEVGSPSFQDQEIRFSAMTLSGWRIADLDLQTGLRFERSNVDELAQASNLHGHFVERDGATSAIWWEPTEGEPQLLIPNAESPILSPDGKRLGFVRSVKGRSSLWVRDLASGTEKRLTGEDLDVYEASWSSVYAIVLSATKGGAPALYRADGESIIPLGINSVRYPSVSPDGSRLAYSKLFRGHWHLTVRDLRTNADRPIESADCNQSWPTWNADSHTLLFASDCGRGLWETSLFLRRFDP